MVLVFCTVGELTSPALVELPPVLFKDCQARRIFPSGTSSGSLKTLFNAYLRTLMRLVVPFHGGVLSLVESPVS